jgi:hypothetical protein
MTTLIMRETAINLHSICKKLKFEGDIDTRVYYDDGEEICLIVTDDVTVYALVVFNENRANIEVRSSLLQHTVRVSNDYTVNVKHLYNIIKETIEHMNDYNNSLRKENK